MRRGWSIAALGVWLWIVPFFSASRGFYGWDNWIVGIIAAALASSVVSRRPLEGWITVAVGAWLFLAGFLGTSLIDAGLWWNGAFMGLALLVFGIRAAAETSHTAQPRTAGHSATPAPSPRPPAGRAPDPSGQRS
jgi:hypothetical protein